MSDNLTQRAYQHIHGKLTGGALSPGVRLSNRTFAKEMGISLTPIRGAFNRLISEGLLEYRPGLGVFVPMPNRREIEELYEFRETLECAAVGKVCGNPSPRMFEEMESSLAELDEIVERLEQAGRTFKDEQQLERLRLVDIRFHLALLRAAGNRRMVETVEDLRIRTRIVCHRFQDEEFSNLPRTADEHRRIIEALRDGDAKEARRVLSDHIRHGCQLALESHDQRYMDSSWKHLGGPHMGI